MKENLEQIERVFLALADKTRIRLVGLMRDGEVTVNYLCETLGESQPKVSRHLAYLRSMSLVNTRREGKWIFYSIAEPRNRFGSQLLRDTLGWIESISISNGDNISISRQTVPVHPQSETTLNPVKADTSGYTHMSSATNDLEVHLL